MTLKELIDFLSACDPATRVPIGFARPHSYRGDYYNLAFEPVRDTTVGNMLAEAKRALGDTFGGYKGGEYTMHDYTDVWLAEYGATGESIGPVLLAYMTGRTSEWLSAEEQYRRDYEAQTRQQIQG